MSTADSWVSYKTTLMLILNHLLPSRCFEWGSGKSTKIISEHPGVNTLDSVEHNPEWISKLTGTLNEKVSLIHEPDECLYALVQGRFDKYDLVFIDGILRESCILKAKELLEDRGIAILHDAERLEYQSVINTYKYKFWRDCGHTIVLTDSQEAANILEYTFKGVANV